MEQTMTLEEAMQSEEEQRANNMTVSPRSENIPVTPVAPEGGSPVYPGPENIPTTPIAPEGGIPAYPGVTLPENVRPFEPGPFPGFPAPIRPSKPNICQVRFLNASTNNLPLNITIGGRQAASNLVFGSVSAHSDVADGFRTVTIVSAVGPRMIFYSQALPFVGGEKLTMVIIDSTNGLDLVKVSDTGCQNMSRDTGCLRMANMSFDNSAYDLLLYGGDVVFSDVRFKEVTPFKQALAGEYQFYMTNTSRYSNFLREIPVIIIGGSNMTNMSSEPLLSLVTQINAGVMYTAYVIGNTWSAFNLRIVIAENQ